MLNNITNYTNLIDTKKVRTLLEASDLFTIGVRDSNFYGNYQPAIITTTNLISSIAGLLPAPPVVDEVINFNQLTPTTPGVVFNPNTPGLTNVLYVSSVDTSTWIWNGTSYQTVPITNNTEWNFLGTSIDAGGNKSLAISRNNSIHTLGYDSYFNSVRIGLGGGNIATNTSVGNNAGALNTIGGSNSFYGNDSGYSNISGTSNSFFGKGSGYSNTIANYNTFIGNQSGFSNTTGEYNTFLGLSSGYSNTIGINNVFTGVYSGFSNLADNNSFYGVNSGYSNATGSFNSFYGFMSGYFNTTGGFNSFFGQQSGYNNSTGSFNTFTGANAGFSNTTGLNNTLIGVSSGSSINGNDNTFLGLNSGRYIADGTTALTTSTNSVFLGGETKALANSQTNQIVIGYNAIGRGSNTVNIGNTSITDTYINGVPHINNTWTLPITAPTAGKVLGYSAPGVSDWVSSSGANLQKEITATYVLTDADDDYTIFVNNGATAISISLGAITVPNFSVGFIQQGTADVTFVGVMTNPVGLKIKGQGYQVFIERKLSTALYYLLGNTKA